MKSIKIKKLSWKPKVFFLIKYMRMFILDFFRVLQLYFVNHNQKSRISFFLNVYLNANRNHFKILFYHTIPYVLYLHHFIMKKI